MYYNTNIEMKVKDNEYEIKFMAAMAFLKDQGVDVIEVHYSGGGDDGCVEEVNFFGPQKNKWKNGTLIESDNIDRDAEIIKPYEPKDEEQFQQIFKFLEDFSYSQVLNSIEDWWNNDGGYGYMYIDTSTGKYYVENNIYFTETETYNHTGQL